MIEGLIAGHDRVLLQQCKNNDTKSCLDEEQREEKEEECEKRVSRR